MSFSSSVEPLARSKGWSYSRNSSRKNEEEEAVSESGPRFDHHIIYRILRSLIEPKSPRSSVKKFPQRLASGSLTYGNESIKHK